MISTIIEFFLPTNPQAIIKPLLKLTDKLEAHTANMDQAKRVLENVKALVQ